MARRQIYVGKPRLLHQVMEPRALLEMAALPWNLPMLARTPRGDGHPVLLLPGFMADEGTLIVLKLFLQNRGYEVQTWGFGRNIGFSSKHASALEQKIRYMHYKSGRTVSLVGWSLGGMFAMYGAHEATECIRSVITLGSPVTFDPEGSQSPPLVKALYRLISHPMGTAAHLTQSRAKYLRQPKTLPVPISCLYSVADGVVPPQEATIDGNPALHENIRVAGQPPRAGVQPAGALDRRRPARAARGPVAAVRAAGRAARADLPPDDLAPPRAGLAFGRPAAFARARLRARAR